MSIDLKPGDFCVIKHFNTHTIEGASLIGRSVILIEIAPPYVPCPTSEPFWHCTNVPKGWIISHSILRKIPPPSLDEDTETDKELTV